MNALKSRSENALTASLGTPVHIRGYDVALSSVVDKILLLGVTFSQCRIKAEQDEYAGTTETESDSGEKHTHTAIICVASGTLYMYTHVIHIAIH